MDKKAQVAAQKERAPRYAMPYNVWELVLVAATTSKEELEIAAPNPQWVFYHEPLVENYFEPLSP